MTDLYPFLNEGVFSLNREEAFTFDLAKREALYIGGGTDAGYLSKFHDVLTGHFLLSRWTIIPLFMQSNSCHCKDLQE